MVDSRRRGAILREDKCIVFTDARARQLHLPTHRISNLKLSKH